MQQITTGSGDTDHVAYSARKILGTGCSRPIRGGRLSSVVITSEDQVLSS